MPAPKGHAPYAGCEKGASFGYLGKPQDAYTQEEMTELGKELVNWFSDNQSEIWMKDFFTFRGICQGSVDYLLKRFPIFREYYDHAKAIQESRLIKYPFFKKADGNHARFILAHAHADFKPTESERSTEIAIAATYISDEIKKKNKASECGKLPLL